MTTRYVSPDGLIDLRLGRWQDVLADVEVCDAVITDPPYGERTHSGHDDGVTVPTRDVPAKNGRTRGDSNRRRLGYGMWTDDDVRACVASWVRRCSGWSVFLTSHDLVPAFEEALEKAGRYVFAPLPYVAPGSRVRLSGDGPSSWTCWVVTARPRALPWAKWGTLPGAYILPPGFKEAMPVVGGKPLWLMRAIVRDYTRPGDLVVDPFCGGATTAIACRMEGRRCITSEQDPETFAKALARVKRGVTPDLFAGVSS